MPLASSKVIDFRASSRIGFAAGVACSAAEFMLCSKASTRAPMPAPRRAFSTMRKLSGMVILMSGLFSNPPALPVSATELEMPCDKASRRPPPACEGVREDKSVAGVAANNGSETVPLISTAVRRAQGRRKHSHARMVRFHGRRRFDTFEVYRLATAGVRPLSWPSISSAT